jgi:hypothetical protein
MTTTSRYGINCVDQGRQSGKSANYLNKASGREEHFSLQNSNSKKVQKSDRLEKYYQTVEKNEVEETRKDKNKSVRRGFCVNSVKRGFRLRLRLSLAVAFLVGGCAHDPVRYLERE